MTLQTFLADATVKAALNLETALLRLPEDKRNWSAGGKARSALNMVAECAIMNESAIAMICDQVFPPDYAHLHYAKEIVALCDDWPRLQRLLHENAAKVADVIRAVPDEQLAEQSDVISYACWNMNYHEGQINFIASLLNCLS